jgi:hypothetical protein
VSEMIERGARALCEAKLWPGAWEKETEGNREEWRMLARAMLRSMREPTDKMAEAIWDKTGDPCWKDDAIKAWQAGIDAALEEK